MQESEPTLDTDYLDPQNVRLFRTPGNDARARLELRGERTYLDVRIARVLPLSDDKCYIALRDGGDKEIGILLTLEGLDPESLRIVEEELTRRYFLPKVLTVTDVKDEYGVVIWDVETDYGPRRYTVRNMRDNTVALTATRALMTDVDGNRFEFTNVEKLSAKAQEVLLKAI